MASVIDALLSATVTEMDMFVLCVVAPLPESKMTIIGDATKRANMRPLLDRETGSMLPETRELLYQFYKPFNERLANVLGDELFNYGYE